MKYQFWVSKCTNKTYKQIYITCVLCWKDYKVLISVEVNKLIMALTFFLKAALGDVTKGNDTTHSQVLFLSPFKHVKGPTKTMLNMLFSGDLKSWGFFGQLTM